MLITFLSDFGLSDEWVGVCRAVILERNPQATIVNLCHTVPSFDVRKGAFLLAAALPALKPAIHLAVVDPGVGTDRRLLAIRAARGDYLVGPDNGLLIPAARRAGGIEEVCSIENDSYFRTPVSRTFEGRDIMAPAVAALSLGVTSSDLGPALSPAELHPAPWTDGEVTTTGARAEVIEIDSFGSVHLAVEEEAAQARGFTIGKGRKIRLSGSFGERPAVGAGTFAEGEEGGLVCLWDSTRYLTIAADKARACDLLGVEAGAEITVAIR